METTIRMAAKKLDLFQRLGLIKIIQTELDEMDYTTHKIENLTCGTTDKGLINLQNTYIEPLVIDSTFYKLGAIGVAKSSDLILQFWDKEENNKVDYLINTATFQVSYEWKEDAVEINLI